MAKAPGINLNNRSLGMSSDEYSGGSFLYGENINISRSSKSFKISDRVREHNVHNRSGYYDIALLGPYPTDNYAIAFSTDGYIESDTGFNIYSTDATRGGPLYKRTSGGYLNAMKVGTKTIAVTQSKLDVYTGDLLSASTGILGSTVVTNRYLTDNTGRTVGAGWTTGASGATHTTGTNTLTQTLTVENAKIYRVTVKMSGCTTGTCAVTMGGASMFTLSSTSTSFSFNTRTTTSTSEAITLTPSNTFNGTINAVEVLIYNYVNIEEDKVTLTTSTTKPMLVTGGMAYIGAGAKIDAINLSDYAIDTYSVIDSSHTIVAIHEIGQSYVIFSNNGEDSKISYWDGISLAPSEVILWKDKVIENVVVDGTLAYAMCRNGEQRSLWMVSGYDKKLIAKNTIQRYGANSLYNAYAIGNRNNFYQETGMINAMGFNGSKVLIPSYYGLYTYGYENPGMVNSLVKEFVIAGFSVTATANIGGQLYISYWNSTTQKGVIAKVFECSSNLTGYLVSNPIVRDNFSTKKQLNRFRLGYIIPDANGSIDIYLNADKYYFWTFYVSGVSVTPTLGTTYTNYNNNVFEVISTDITAGAGTITCRATTLLDTQFSYGGALIKINGTGDTSINYSDYDNFVKIKTITASKYTAGEELIFGQEFLTGFMPDWHTIQFKIKLTTTNAYGSPEVFDMPILSEPVGQNA